MKSELASALCLAVVLGVAASGEDLLPTSAVLPARDINVNVPIESSSQNSASIDPLVVPTPASDEVASGRGPAPLGANFSAMLMVVTALICIVVLRRRFVIDTDATLESRSSRQPVSRQDLGVVHPDQARTVR